MDGYSKTLIDIGPSVTQIYQEIKASETAETISYTEIVVNMTIHAI